MISYINAHLSGENQLKTEYGLLKREDFNHVQKIMEVYAKCLLYEKRVKHQKERLSLLQNQDFKGYIEKLMYQISDEIQ